MPNDTSIPNNPRIVEPFVAYRHQPSRKARYGWFPHPQQGTNVGKHTERLYVLRGIMKKRAVSHGPRLTFIVL